MRRRRPRDNAEQKHRTTTKRRFVPHDEKISELIYERALQQIGVRNRTTEHLLEHGPTAVRKSPKAPRALFALFQEWRVEETWLNDLPQKIWRPAVEAAAAAYNAWEETNEEHVRLIVEGSKTTKKKPRKTIPRRVQRRRPDPERLFVSRKERDRANSHTVRFDEGVKRVDDHVIHVPGIGDIPIRKKIGKTIEVRSVTIVERTPRARAATGSLKPGDRTWVLHLACRQAAPLPDLPAEGITSAGGDHGCVHPLTTSWNDGSVRMLHYDDPKAESVREWNRRECLKAKCKRGSRRWRKLTAEQATMRRHESNRQTEQLRKEANLIAAKADIVGIEDLDVRNMMLSAQGTNEHAGKNVAAKRGLNRRLQKTAPGKQKTELIQACERHVTRYLLVPAKYTSITCSVCGHRAKENRESQEVFRCRRCTHTANADVNAGENDRHSALAHYGVGVDRSPRPQSPEKSLLWGVAMTAAGGRTAAAEAVDPFAQPPPKRRGPGDTTREKGGTA